MEKNHRKSDFRLLCIKRLKFIQKRANFKNDKIIEKKIFEIIKSQKVKNVLAYLPLKIEVNIMSLLFKLRKEGINVYVPYLEGDSFKVVKFRLPLKKYKFGLRQPNNCFLNPKLDLAIVPIIGVDKDYKRIGYGAGMYDRFFARLSYKPKIIFTQRELCRSCDSLSSWHDIEPDYIITN